MPNSPKQSKDPETGCETDLAASLVSIEQALLDNAPIEFDLSTESISGSALEAEGDLELGSAEVQTSVTSFEKASLSDFDTSLKILKEAASLDPYHSYSRFNLELFFSKLEKVCCELREFNGVAELTGELVAVLRGASEVGGRIVVIDVLESSPIPEVQEILTTEFFEELKLYHALQGLAGLDPAGIEILQKHNSDCLVADLLSAQACQPYFMAKENVTSGFVGSFDYSVKAAIALIGSDKIEKLHGVVSELGLEGEEGCRHIRGSYEGRSQRLEDLAAHVSLAFIGHESEELRETLQFIAEQSQSYFMKQSASFVASTVGSDPERLASNFFRVEFIKKWNGDFEAHEQVALNLRSRISEDAAESLRPLLDTSDWKVAKAVTRGNTSSSSSFSKIISNIKAIGIYAFSRPGIMATRVKAAIALADVFPEESRAACDIRRSYLNSDSRAIYRPARVRLESYLKEKR